MTSEECQCNGLNSLQYIQESMLTAESITFAIAVCLFLWAIFLRTKIYYGDNTVNKLMLKPFNTAIVSLVAKGVQTILKIFNASKIACIIEECNPTDPIEPYV